ncbi:MAG: hypothetical protein U5R31_15465, partial [Acidimicrobiia bacterium]|nr:hypothetical protein [Acidimicrobiia bacterium]
MATNSGSAPNGFFQNDIATVLFPAVGGGPSVGNVVVRLGVARGYGGANAFNPNIGWRTTPGTQRLAGAVGFNTSNLGDRALAISDESDAVPGAATGTWFRNATLIPLGNWATFTMVIAARPELGLVCCAGLPRTCRAPDDDRPLRANPGRGGPERRPGRNPHRLADRVEERDRPPRPAGVGGRRARRGAGWPG